MSRWQGSAGPSCRRSAVPTTCPRRLRPAASGSPPPSGCLEQREGSCLLGQPSPQTLPFQATGGAERSPVEDRAPQPLDDFSQTARPIYRQGIRQPAHGNSELWAGEPVGAEQVSQGSAL